MIQFWVASWKQNGKFVDDWVVAHGGSFFGGLNHQGHLVQSQVLSRSTGWNPFAAAPCRSQYSKHPRRNSAKFGNQVEPHMQGHGPIVILPWNLQLLTPLESNYVITIDDFYKWITIYIYILYITGARGYGHSPSKSPVSKLRCSSSSVGTTSLAYRGTGHRKWQQQTQDQPGSRTFHQKIICSWLYIARISPKLIEYSWRSHHLNPFETIYIPIMSCLIPLCCASSA